MPRFFLTPEQSDFTPQTLPDTICLQGEDAFHLSVSLRAGIGDPVTLCTPDGLEVDCRIEAISGGKKSPLVTLRPLSASESENEPPAMITLYQGMPKGKKTDSILQKCTELGVGKVVFVYTDHSVPVWDGDDKKTLRYQKIAEEAAKQCGRGRLVEVSLAESLDSVLEDMKANDVCFACYEKEGERSLKQILSEKRFETAAFFIGPEGGLSEREVALLNANSVPTVTLGKRILRTETAPAAVLAMLLYETEL